MFKIKYLKNIEIMEHKPEKKEKKFQNGWVREQ
jgi:hypothetical protein